jgi:hypothetical protein
MQKSQRFFFNGSKIPADVSCSSRNAGFVLGQDGATTKQKKNYAMKKNLVACLASVAALALTAGSTQAQVIISHWSFDTSTLTVDGGTGDITGASDSTGLHNAVNTDPTGGAGGTQYTSAAFPGSASVGGQFGEALTFTGDGTSGNFMTFPNLTELMAASGAPSYTVSFWVNTTMTGNNNFTLLSNWGNSDVTPGRFTYGFGFQSDTLIRAQTRFDNSSTNGGDIFADTAPIPSLADANWHMLTWTFDTTTGLLSSYFDGSFVETFQSTATSFQMIDASSTAGSFGIKGDNGTFLNGSISFDEVYVVNGALDATAVETLYLANVVIPEPTTLALLAGGLTLLGLRLRRRQS